METCFDVFYWNRKWRRGLSNHKDDIKPTGVGFQGLFKTHLGLGSTDHTSAGAGSSCPERAAPVCRWGWGWAWRRRSSSSSQAWRAEEPPADESDCRPDQWCSPQTCRPAAVKHSIYDWDIQVQRNLYLMETEMMVTRTRITLVTIISIYCHLASASGAWWQKLRDWGGASSLRPSGS